MGARHTKQAGDPMLRPGADWVSDSRAELCHRCGDPFTVTRRRHHCRVCGEVYCSECCPKNLAKLRRSSMPPEQRPLRLCKSCTLPAWMLPTVVTRYVSPAAAVAHSSSVRLAANAEQLIPVDQPRCPGGVKPGVLTGFWRQSLDGAVMQAVLEFLSDVERSAVLATHPTIRHYLPVPNIRFENSVSSVYPGVIVTADEAHSGHFPVRSAYQPPCKVKQVPGTVEAAKIGAGGFGVVYQAFDHRYGAFVAVKLLTKDFASLPYSYSRSFGVLEREIDVHKRMTETGGVRRHIAALLDVFQTRSTVVAVVGAGEGRCARSATIEMRTADQSELHAYLPVPDIVTFTLLIAHDLCVALQHMADNNYAHRDIKLDNVILTRDYRQAYLIDFGLSTAIGMPKGYYAPVGTPSFMSPEVLDCSIRKARTFAADKDAILASDVYSLGATMHYMLSGTRIYHSNDFRTNLLTARYGLSCDGQGWERVPAVVRRLVRSMLEFNPLDRPTFQQIIDHPCMKDPAFDRGAMVARRRARIAADDYVMRMRWDFCDDAYDDDDDDVAVRVAAPATAKAPVPAQSRFSLACEIIERPVNRLDMTHHTVHELFAAVDRGGAGVVEAAASP